MKITILRLGVCNCFLIKGRQGYVMVDAGDLKQFGRFKRLINERDIIPEDIKLIIITHAHFDHVANLAEIKRLCQCPVLIHPYEASVMAAGQVLIPPGTNALGHLVSGIGKRIKPLLAFKACEGEIMVDKEFDLKPYGVDGTVLSTPGHTPGSLSVLLDDGRAMVGDLAMNFMGARVYPLFAELPLEVYSSWDLLVKRGAQMIFPAHGYPFSVERIKESMKKYTV